jgi:hypothetical protein
MTSPLIDTVRNGVTGAFAALVAFASRLSPARLAWGGLALGAVILLSVNLISSELFGGWKADLTQDRLFTISPGSATVLSAIEEPIKVQLYFSSKLGERARPPSRAIQIASARCSRNSSACRAASFSSR